MNEKQRKAEYKYKKAHIKSILLALHKENDADIIDWCGQQSNRQGAIKALIRNYGIKSAEVKSL